MSNSAHRGKPRRRPAIIALISLVSVVGIGTAAYAYWTTTGAGEGRATTGDADDLVVNQTTTVTDLYPGITPVPLEGTITNPDDGAVTVGALNADVTAVLDENDNPVAGCAPANYDIVGTGAPSTSVVPGSSSSVTWSGLSVTMLNTQSNQDACKGASIVITYELEPGPQN